MVSTKTALQVIMDLNKVCHFSSNEKKGEKASNSELRARVTRLELDVAKLQDVQKQQAK